jgi:hypothetical protein
MEPLGQKGLASAPTLLHESGEELLICRSARTSVFIGRSNDTFL